MGIKKPYFPMFVDISEKKIVVVGGGRIAERRVDTLLKFAMDITVIAPKVTERLREMSEDGKVRWIAAAFCEDIQNSGLETTENESWGKECPPDAELFLQNADMVLAATNDSSCNEWIMRICRGRGILVNVSHKKELCDFYFPAVVVKDDVTVGITSNGLSHRKARKAREQVEAAL